jgi:ribosomal-protein-serine acetyltransferase
MKQRLSATIEGKKISLHRLKPADTGRLYKLVGRNLDHITENFPRLSVACENWQGADKYVVRSNMEWNEGKQFRFLLMKPGVNEAVGYLSIKSLDWDIPKCEMGYFVDEHYTGQGLASEALAMACDICFQQLEMEKIYLRVLKGNQASKRVAEKNHFRLEGVLQREFRDHEGVLRDVWYFGRVRP